MTWLVIALGGALGAMARYGITTLWLPTSVSGFPWGTFIANVGGSLCIGVVYVLIMYKPGLSEYWKPLVMTGFLGAFTTYSSFALESVLLWQQGQISIAISYALASLFACIIAVALSVSVMLKFFN